MDRSKITISPYGQCWVEVDAKYQAQLAADGLIAVEKFGVGFKLNPKSGKYETTVQSGIPAKAEKLGYNVIWD